MTGETGRVLTHLGLEPVRELGPEPVELQAHFSVHADAHVVVHHLRLHLNTTGMSAVEQENERRERHRSKVHPGRAQSRSTSCASGAAKYLSDQLNAAIGMLMKGAFPSCPYYPLIFSAWAGATSKPMAHVLFSAPAHCQQHCPLCTGKHKREAHLVTLWALARHKAANALLSAAGLLSRRAPILDAHIPSVQQRNCCMLHVA